MSKAVDEAPAVRVRKTIQKEKDIYISVGPDICLAKFAYEHRPENKELREAINAVCDAVTEGLLRLDLTPRCECQKQ